MSESAIVERQRELVRSFRAKEAWRVQTEQEMIARFNSEKIAADQVLAEVTRTAQGQHDRDVRAATDRYEATRGDWDVTQSRAKRAQRAIGEVHNYLHDGILILDSANLQHDCKDVELEDVKPNERSQDNADYSTLALLDPLGMNVAWGEIQDVGGADNRDVEAPVPSVDDLLNRMESTASECKELLRKLSDS